MQMRKLGNSGIEIAPLVFGGNVFGWSVDEPTAFTLLDAFIGAGFNGVDTADMYSTWVPGHKGGESETIIGNWFKRSGKRDKVVLMTKVGMDMGAGRKGLSGNYILRAVEDSLRRLQTDRIDLYQSHTDDASTPLEETLGAYQQLVKQGKVRAVGASNYTAPRLSEALKVARDCSLPGYQSLQPHYNLYDRAPYESALESLCLKENIGVIPYYSLASGFLSGKYRSESDAGKSNARGQGVKQYLNDRGLRILNALDKAAMALHTKPASVALAWLMARKSVTAPIASATGLKQLDELLAAAELKLDADTLLLLNEASGYGAAAGAAA